MGDGPGWGRRSGGGSINLVLGGPLLVSCTTGSHGNQNGQLYTPDLCNVPPFILHHSKTTENPHISNYLPTKLLPCLPATYPFICMSVPPSNYMFCIGVGQEILSAKLVVVFVLHGVP